MVCAALGNLAMAQSFKAQTEDVKRQQLKVMMKSGLFYCQNVLTDFYTLLSYYDYYSFERVAVFYDITGLDGKNWHKLMSKKVIAAQNQISGEFVGSGFHLDHSHKAPLLATAYAVLFLKKATKKLYRTGSIE